MNGQKLLSYEDLISSYKQILRHEIQKYFAANLKNSWSDIVHIFTGCLLYEWHWPISTFGMDGKY